MTFLTSLLGEPLKVRKAHAASASRHVDGPLEWAASPFTVLTGPGGSILGTKGRVIVQAEGSSLEAQGIESGERLLARLLSPGEAAKLEAGSIVIVRDATAASNLDLCLRIVDHVADGMVYFAQSPTGVSHGPRDLNQVEGVVEYELA
jgi:hypothetical protein